MCSGPDEIKNTAGIFLYFWWASPKITAAGPRLGKNIEFFNNLGYYYIEYSYGEFLLYRIFTGRICSCRHLNSNNAYLHAKQIVDPFQRTCHSLGQHYNFPGMEKTLDILYRNWNPYIHHLRRFAPLGRFSTTLTRMILWVVRRLTTLRQVTMFLETVMLLNYL
jgi:hypothetical protein